MNEHEYKHTFIDLLIQAVNHDKTPFVINNIEWAMNNHQKDIYFNIDNIDTKFAGEIKRNVRINTVGAAIRAAEDFNHNEYVVLADYVTQAIANAFRDNGIQFIDTCGNAFINQKNYYVFVAGNKKILDQQLKNNAPTRKMTTTAGLKVLFALLDKPGLVASSYRVIAIQAGVALGIIPQVIRNLKEEGFLADNRGERRLLHKERLALKWTEHYPYKLRDRLKYAELVAPETYWWRDFRVEQFKGQWGGETGAAILTNYLEPEIQTIYLPKHEKINFIKAAKLKPVRVNQVFNGQLIELVEPFWKVSDKNNKIAPVLVIYADLIQTGESRNIEMAKKIYEDYLVGHLKKD